MTYFPCRSWVLPYYCFLFLLSAAGFFFLLSAAAVYTAAAAEGFQSTFSFPIATAAAAAIAYVVLDAAATVAGIVDGGR